MDEPPGYANAPRFTPLAPSVWPKEWSYAAKRCS